jgi:hypothetical protein
VKSSAVAALPAMRRVYTSPRNKLVVFKNTNLWQSEVTTENYSMKTVALFIATIADFIFYWYGFSGL